MPLFIINKNRSLQIPTCIKVEVRSQVRPSYGVPGADMVQVPKSSHIGEPGFKPPIIVLTAKSLKTQGKGIIPVFMFPHFGKLMALKIPRSINWFSSD